MPDLLPRLIINNHSIERQKVNKFLGILIHKNLTWKDHIKYVKQKVSKGIGIMYKTRHIVDQNNLKQLYFAFINSYLSYGTIIWGSACKTHLEPLYIKQKHASRIVLNIYQLNVFSTACFMFKNLILKETPKIFHNLFKTKVNKYKMRSKGLYKKTIL